MLCWTVYLPLSNAHLLLQFMTLRRLNIKIQGLPESYATEPYMGESMVVGEPHPIPSPLAIGSETRMMHAEDPMNAIASPPDVDVEPADEPLSHAPASPPMPESTKDGPDSLADATPATPEGAIGDEKFPETTGSSNNQVEAA